MGGCDEAVEILAALLGHTSGAQGDQYEKRLLARQMMTHKRSYTEWFKHAAR